MNPRVIAYTGTHGTGKTTSVFERAAALKKEYPGKTVGILNEVAARSPYPINLLTTEKSQLWIFTHQIEEELILLDRYDLVVSDRTALDAVAYTHAVGYHAMAEDMLRLFSHHMGVYREINFKRYATNNFCRNDGVRDTHDKDFRAIVETLLHWMYRRLNIAGQDRFRIQ